MCVCVYILGRYQDEEGQVLCKVAEPGYFVQGAGAVKQSLCEEGTYQNLPEQLECKVCDPGHGPMPEWPIAPVRCVSCTIGKHSTLGAGCIDCESGFEALIVNATNCTDVDECGTSPSGLGDSACHPAVENWSHLVT